MCVDRIALAATVALWLGILLHVIVAAERSVLALVLVLVVVVLVMVLVVLVVLITLMLMVVVAIRLLLRRAPVAMPVARAGRPMRWCHSLVEEVLLRWEPHAGVAGARARGQDGERRERRLDAAEERAKALL